MTDVEFSGPGKQFHRRSSRVLKSCVCANGVTQPTTKICVQPAKFDQILGPDEATCWSCPQNSYIQAAEVHHGLDKTLDDAVDGLHLVHTYTAGGNLYEIVYWYRTYREMTLDPAPVEYTGTQCQWQYGRQVSWDYIQDNYAVDPRDILVFSDFVPRYDAAKDLSGGVFFSQLWNTSTGIQPNAVIVQNYPIVVKWRRVTGPFLAFPEVTIDVYSHSPFDTIIVSYLREVTVSQGNVSTVCGSPPTFVVGGGSGVTINAGTGGV